MKESEIAKNTKDVLFLLNAAGLSSVDIMMVCEGARAIAKAKVDFDANMAMYKASLEAATTKEY